MRTEETKMENNSNTQEIILDRNRNGLPVLILVIAGYVAAQCCGSASAGSCSSD